MKLILYADGGSRGNPGPAAAGAVLLNEQGEIIARLKSDLGPATNNQAEYAAVIIGLTRALGLSAVEVQVFLDSKLIVEQLSGRWKIKDLKIKKLAERAHTLLAQFQSWKFQHIPREKNSAADALVNEILDAKCGPKKVFRWNKG
jgi:probable phosphoglycerate mutase